MKPILIVGGGISGITAAVELAEAGKEVVLIEKQAYLGGNVAQMNNYFPKLCPPSCGLEINFSRIRRNPRISVYNSTEITSISGKKGNFKISFQTAPQLVKNTCTACGKCVDVCPVERSNDFNRGFDKTKAIYIPYDMAFPMKYHIDNELCKKTNCAKCVAVCDFNAIDLTAKATKFDLEVNSVILATGWKNYDANNLPELAYKQEKNVITNVELERLLAPNGPGKGKLLRPSDQKPPKKVSFVQCAGSRDDNHLPYCSAVCCSASLKHALNIHEMYPECEISIFYIDLRVSGRNEDFLRKVEDAKNISLIKGKVAKIKAADNNIIIVEAEDILNAKKIHKEADLVVLATGIVPQTNSDLFIESGTFYADQQQDGIYPVSCCKKPMDVSSSVKEATAAALKAIQ